MGIRRFVSFINEVPEVFKTVNILEEIQNYQNATGKVPVIIINLLTIAHLFKKDVGDSILGCRLNIIEQTYDEFLKKLKHAGAELIFVFKKTDSLKNEPFIYQKETEYAKARELICQMKTMPQFERLKAHYENKLAKGHFVEFPINEATFFVLCQAAQRYGRIYGMDSYRNRVTKFQIDLANEKHAMAVIGLNSHYFLFDGSWAFWSDRELDMDAMTIRQYDRQLVLQHLNLTYEQMPLFAALAGGLNCEATTKNVVMYFRPWEKEFFKRAADFVNQQQFPLTNSSVKIMISKILGTCSSTVFEDFKESIKSMGSKQQLCKIETDVMKSIKNDIANIAEEILEQSTILISPVYLNESNMGLSINDLVMPLVQRTAGVLLTHREYPKDIKVMTKDSSSKKLKVVRVPPSFPAFSVLPLEQVVNGQLTMKEKVQILSFILEVPLEVEEVELIPSEYFIDVVVCMYLLKTREIKMFEAEILMQSIVETHDSSSTAAKRKLQLVSERAFRISFLYTKLFVWLYSCFSAVGLKSFTNNLKFDALRFQQLYSRPLQQNRQMTHKEMLSKLIFITNQNFNDMKEKECLRADDDSISNLKNWDAKISSNFEGGHFQIVLKLLLELESERNLTYSQLSIKAECLVRLGRLLEAQITIDKALKDDPQHHRMIYVQGLKHYHELKLRKSIYEFEKAIASDKFFVEALTGKRWAIVSLKALKEGYSKMASNNYQEACHIFQKALLIDGGNEKFTFKIMNKLGLAHFCLNRYQEAHKYYSHALEIEEADADCLFNRAQAHFKLNEFEDCIIDCEESLNVRPSDEAKSLIKAADSALQRIPQKLPYQFLEIHPQSSPQQAKEAFHKLSLIYHADKNPNATAVVKLKLNK